MGKLAGGFIDVYLLEKSRVTYQQDNERGYHIFFQLVEEGPVPGLKDLCLLSDDIYDYFFVSQVWDSKMDVYVLSDITLYIYLWYCIINLNSDDVREKPKLILLMITRSWSLPMPPLIPLDSVWKRNKMHTRSPLPSCTLVKWPSRLKVARKVVSPMMLPQVNNTIKWRRNEK